MLWFSSELAQKTRAEREAKQALHEAGVAKKKEIIARSVVIKVDREVKENFEIFYLSICSRLDTSQWTWKEFTKSWKWIKRKRRSHKNIWWITEFHEYF